MWDGNVVDVDLGFEFSIRTPGTPSRWAQMDQEMGAAWKDYLTLAERQTYDVMKDVDWFIPISPFSNLSPFLGGSWIFPNLSHIRSFLVGWMGGSILGAVLRLFFYWVNFAPLSRGSAACGYALVHSLLLSLGLQAIFFHPL